eukprot:TRINITY_DN15816_c0_g1_i3.p1 TRINITY_DN15816_c0_g1~~TRINITY_DN15816_c0_g1_i3.p1  ORF type:complete len:657 (+),score=259.61 TRINITY_DN15816_c0_g1_i3:3047-5017(+)
MGNKVNKRERGFITSGRLDAELKYRKKGKKVKHDMMDAEKRRIERERQAEEDEERKHKEDLQRLDEIDPEFKEYLDKNEPGFGEMMEDELDATLAQDEDGEEEEGTNTLQQEKVEEWFESLSSGNSLRALKKCIAAFRAAASVGYLGVGDASSTSAVKTTEVFTYIVSEATALIPQSFDNILKRKKGGKAPHKCEDWDKIRACVRSYATGLATLLVSQGLPDDLATHVLKYTVPLVEHLYTHTGAARALLKGCLHHVAQRNEKLQLMAFLVVRDMATPGRLPPPFTDICMKGMYLTFVKNTHSFTFETYSTVSYVMNQCVELFAVDLASAYQHVFVNTRQLAVYLRTALQSGAGEEAFRHVYNWQYVNSLRLWAMTVARYHDEKELLPLVYPLAQIACGVVELFPAPKTFPLHLIVLSVINHMSRVTGSYIPITSYLLRILSSPEFQKGYKTGDGKPVDLMFMLRAKKADMANVNYQTAVFNEALYLLQEHLAIHSHSMGFPEMVYPVVARLKKLAKEVHGPKWSQAVNTVLQRIKNNTQFILAKRKDVGFGPSNIEKVTAFEANLKETGTPLSKHFAKEKERRDESRKMRLEALKGGSRKTVDDYADDETDSEEEDLADLAAAEDVDDEESEPEGADEEEEEEEAPQPPQKRRRK